MAEQPVLFELTPQSEKLLRDLTFRWGQDAVYERIVGFFDRQSSIIAGRISKSFLSGDPVRRRTGNLARSIIGRGELVGGLPALRVGVFRGPALRYAGVVEYGTRGKNPQSPYPTIVPKKAKALAIPAEDGPAVTAAGVHRYDGPRSFPGELHFVPVLRGRVIGLLQTDDDETAYLLLRSVDIAPRFYLRDGFLESLPELTTKMADFLAKYLSGN